MKTISNVSHRALLIAAILGCGFTLPCPAQGTPPAKAGFIRLVNAVAQGDGQLTLFIDGDSVNPDGYSLGDVTGGIGLTPGSHDLVIKRNGVKEGTTRVSIVADATTTLIPFAERIPASDDKPAHWEMRILRLKQMEPETARSATFVSVSQAAEHEVEIRDPKGNWTTVRVKRLAIARTPILYPEGYVPLRGKAGKLPSIPVGDPGNYVVVLYDDKDGNMKALNLQDYKYLSAD